MADKYAHIKEEVKERRKQEKMCLSKKAFKSKGKALEIGQNIYTCPYCKKYHRTGKIQTLVNTYKKKVMKSRLDEIWTLEKNEERIEQLSEELLEVSKEIGKIDKELNNLENRKNRLLKDKAKWEKKMSHNTRYKNRLIEKVIQQKKDFKNGIYIK